MTLCVTVPDGTPSQRADLMAQGQNPVRGVIANVSSLTDIAPLTREYYVDAGTAIAPADQDGSIAFPFSTLTAALTALALVAGGVLLIAPGDYSAQGAVTVPALCPTDFVNQGARTGGIVTLHSIIGSSAVALVNITVAGGGGGTVNVGAGNNLRMQSSSTTSNVTCQDATVNDCAIGGNLVGRALTVRATSVAGTSGATGLVLWRDSSVVGLSSWSGVAVNHRFENSVAGFIIANGAGATLLMRNSQLSSNLLVTAVDMEGCTVAGTVDCPGATRMVDCTIGGVTTLTVAAGTIVIDNCRFAASYTANGAATTTSFSRSTMAGGIAFNARIAVLFGSEMGGVVTTLGNLTASFVAFGLQVVCGGAATFYQARCSNITAITGQLFTDFESIAGVIPVLSYASIIINQTAPRITLVVNVPAVAANAVGYVNVSLVGTALVGMLTADSLIVASPVVDLVAAGAGGGFINARFNAANSIRFAFVGALAGGNADFIVGLV